MSSDASRSHRSWQGDRRGVKVVWSSFAPSGGLWVIVAQKLGSSGRQGVSLMSGEACGCPSGSRALGPQTTTACRPGWLGHTQTHLHEGPASALSVCLSPWVLHAGPSRCSPRRGRLCPLPLPQDMQARSARARHPGWGLSPRLSAQGTPAGCPSPTGTAPSGDPEPASHLAALWPSWALGRDGAAASFSGRQLSCGRCPSPPSPHEATRPGLPCPRVRADGAGTGWLPLRVKDAFSCQKVSL